MKNHNLNQNQQKDTSSLPKSWEEIVKAKTSSLDKKEEITELIKTAPDFYRESKAINLIRKIYEINKVRIQNSQPLKSHGNLLNLVASPDVLRVAYRELAKNKGAMTPGTEGSTADNVSEELIQKISSALMDGTFTWSRVKRVFIPKPGRKEKRPLGLPDFHNKIVQSAIRYVLYAVWEPEMEKYSTNAGFRPGLSCADAISDILTSANGSDWCIEGDIKGAFDNVDHRIMIEILKQRIDDKKLLDLIYKGFKSGLLVNNVPQPTLLGIPQGGIASPYLFNIYLHELDKYIVDVLKPEYENKAKSDKVDSQTYALISKQKRAKSKLREIVDAEISIKDLTSKLSHKELISIINMYRQDFDPLLRDLDTYNQFKQYEYEVSNVPEDELEAFRTYQRFRNSKNNEQPKALGQYGSEEQILIRQGLVRQNQFKLVKKQILSKIESKGIDLLEILKKYKNTTIAVTKDEMLKLQYFESSQKKIKIFYKRYADDWTLWLRGDLETANEIKQRIGKFLQEKLKLTLSLEKTKITNPRKELVRFLDFEIHYQKNPLIVRRKNTEQGQAFTQRYSKLQAHPERERTFKRFVLKGYANPDGSPKEVGFLSVLKDHEIIEKYNSFMLGIGNYYIRQISYPSRLNRWHYLLYFSCLKTLAAKHKTTVKRIILKHGFTDLSNPSNSRNIRATDQRICIKYQQDSRFQWKVLLNYKEFMFRLETIRSTARPPRQVDFQTLNKVNFRTAFKLTTACAVCGSKEKIQSHHIRPIKHGGGRFKGFKVFDKVVAALGRKQIPVCAKCHTDIHQGKYDGISLNELYDARLVAPEGLIRLQSPNDHKNPNISGQRLTGGDQVEINEQNKTYYNPLFYNYLTRHKQL